MYDFNEMTNRDPIDVKIELLHDFDILRSSVKKEVATRRILADCKNELQMDIKLHDLLRGKVTLDDIIEKEGIQVMKIVVYKNADIYYATNEENYKARIQDARAIYKMDNFNSAEEVVEYFCKYCGAKPEDFIIIANAIKGEN